MHTLLKSYGMDMYGKLCCNRIANTEKIDGEHVYIDFTTPGHILFDKDGILKCKEILRSYISEEDFNILEDYLRLQSEDIAAKNEIINLYDSLSKKLLLDKKNIKDKSSTEYQFAKAELASRMPYWRLFLRIKGWFFEKAVLIKYFKKIHLYKKIVSRDGINKKEEVVILEDKKDIHEDGNIYSIAYRRFMKNNSDVTFKQWTEDRIKQYAFLGVKAYGSEYIHRDKKKSIQGITARYKELSKIMRSIGMLSPNQLQQIFPIKKEYDGAEYGMKDYFYTSQALKKIGLDKSIGNEMEAAHLLWDYVNDDISFFIMAYMGCIEDMYLHEINEEPFKEFYGKEGV